MSNKKWQVKESTETKPGSFSPLLNSVLQSRELDDAAISDLTNERPLDDPFLMHDMQKAVERIKAAITNDEPILVYGDYDADGVTSTAIMMRTLNQLGAAAAFYIPNRFTEGYGPNMDAFNYAAEEGVKLIITVDNGIKGFEEIAAVQDRVDVILTDHHEIGDSIPDAYAVVHPAHPAANYPTASLAGAGVALKLSEALLGEVDETNIALAAIGTVSDLVPLTLENRTIVKQGLKVLNRTPIEGVRALLEQAGFKGELTEETIGFMIGPRLNAIGRLDDARPAAELLLETDQDEAHFLAEQIEAYNIERKEIVSDITQQALEIAQRKVESGRKFLIISGEDWNEGVLGIVASKIVETYYLPVIVLNLNYEAGYAKGSARSIDEVSMYDALDAQKELLSKFGGHHMAAGLTLPIQNVDELELKLNEALEDAASFQQVLHIDAVADMAEITPQNIKDLEVLRPYGTGNPKPLFLVPGVSITEAKAIGTNGAHLKLKLEHLAGLKWNAGDLAASLPVGVTADVCGSLQLNEWNGTITPQLMIEDIKVHDVRWIDLRNQHPSRYAFLKDADVAFLINEGKEKLSDAYYFYGESIAGHDKIVLRDLPRDLTQLKETLELSDATEIYVIFHTDKQLYFEGMPRIESFRALYKKLYAAPVSLVDEGMQLADYLGVSPDMLMFMMKVMTELNLLEYKSDKFHLNKESGKVDFEDSELYQRRRRRLQAEQELLYSPFDELKKL